VPDEGVFAFDPDSEDDDVDVDEEESLLVEEESVFVSLFDESPEEEAVVEDFFAPERLSVL
jgi:hypothetical protein